MNRFLLVAPLLGLFTVSCGDNFDSRKGDGAALCVYDGVLYEMGQNWRAKDGCNECHCGFNEPVVMCTTVKICRDGGASDGLSSHDASPKSDVLSTDAVADKAQDVSSLDVPAENDGSVDAADGVAGDGRLASERD